MIDNSPDEFALCQACGLCCQGQLYNRVSLRPEEVALVKTWPVEMVTRGDEVSFAQPCGCFQAMHCTVYSQRPRTCVEYSCQLLRRLRHMEISQAAALERVVQARGLFEQIQAHLSEATVKPIWQRIIDRWDLTALQPLLSSGELHMDTLMAIVALDVLLTKYFRITNNKTAAPDGG